jgi:hypothetical protein
LMKGIQNYFKSPLFCFMATVGKFVQPIPILLAYLVPIGVDVVPIKYRSVENFQCQESIRDIVIYPHMKSRWIRTMLNLCSIVAAILKMATGRNFSISGINSGHHNLPTYEMSLKSDNVEFVQYCGSHFENGHR